MELDDIKRLYYSNLVMLRHSMDMAVTDPLGIDGKWYWAEDEGGDCESEIRNRVQTTGPDIVEFLRLHRAALDCFDTIERIGNGDSKDYDAMFAATDRVLDVLGSYEALVTRHKGRDGLREYLEYPNSPPEFNTGRSRQGIQNMLFALHGITMRLRVSDLRGFELGQLASSRPPYTPREVPSWTDGSYRGRFEFVQYELTTKFGLIT